jgi:hypothetical protein
VRAAGKAFANNACLFAVQQKTQDYLWAGNFVALEPAGFYRRFHETAA